jgi:hypothetical protein
MLAPPCRQQGVAHGEVAGGRCLLLDLHSDNRAKAPRSPQQRKCGCWRPHCSASVDGGGCRNLAQVDGMAATMLAEGSRGRIKKNREQGSVAK